MYGVRVNLIIIMRAHITIIHTHTHILHDRARPQFEYISTRTYSHTHTHIHVPHVSSEPAGPNGPRHPPECGRRIRGEYVDDRDGAARKKEELDEGAKPINEAEGGRRGGKGLCGYVVNM